MSLFERALSIREKKLGTDHPDTVNTQRGLEFVRKQLRAEETA